MVRGATQAQSSGAHTVLRGWPLIGSLVPFARDPLGFLDRIAADHGDRVQFQLVQHQVFFVNDPSDVEQVLVKHSSKLHKDAIYALLHPALGEGLVTSEDDTWRRHRKLAAPSFTARHVEGYAETMVALTQQHAEALEPGASVDLLACMSDLARDIALATLFGADLEVDASPVAHCLDVVMDHFAEEVQGVHRLLPSGVPTPARSRHRQAIAELDRTIYAIIGERRRVGLGGDLLSRLIAARDDEGDGFGEKALRDEAVTAFLAGHETTALTLTYTHHLLANHPPVLERLLAELREVLGGRTATVADAGALPYLRAVVQEAMRVLPPVWAIGREVQAPLPLAGFEIPVGWQVLVSPWVLHRDSRWFPDPAAFRPERWLEPGFTESMPRMAYLPFGAGPRICIGKHFAMLEAVLVMATLLQRVWLRSTEPLPRLLPSITMRPTGPVPAEVEAPRG